MNVAEIGLGATVVAAIALVLTITALRLLPPRADSQQGQSSYLMNQLIAKTGEADKAQAENRELRAEVATLRVKVNALEAEVSDLWAMLRSQGVRIDETRAATNAAYNEPRKATVRPPVDVTMSEDIPFREWLILHFDPDELKLVCADLKMAEPPAMSKIAEAATHTIREARKNGKLSALEAVALERRPHVQSW